jgi:hypothetical protein
LSFGRTPRKLAPTTISLEGRTNVLDVLEAVTEARDVDASPSALTSTLADSVRNLANLVAGQAETLEEYRVGTNEMVTTVEAAVISNESDGISD